jgi:protocatechuate 3,4-dioxygenase beta subunit
MRTDRELDRELERLAGLIKPPTSVLDQVMQRLETQPLPTQTPPPARIAPDVPTDGADGVASATRPKEQPPRQWHVRLRLIAICQRKSVRWSAVAAVAAGVVLAVGLWPNNPREHSGQRPAQGIVWADVVKNIETADNIHVTHTMRVGKQNVTGEAWLCRPHKYRVEIADQFIIDNGKKRLTLDKKNRTAQWTESPLAHGSRETESISSMVDMFRTGPGPEVQLKKIDEESTAERLVYTATALNTSATSKIWIRANSLLLERLEMSDPSTDRSMQFTFSYDPIPDSVFVMSVPEGFKELAIPEPGRLSGRVLNVDGTPVANATVYIAGPFYLDQCRSNDRGGFTLEFPPEGAPNHDVNFPIFLRAVRPGDLDHVAWTLIRGPDDHDSLGGPIPGEPGNLEIARHQGWVSCSSATGIVLKMEPATSLGGLVTDTDGKPIAGAEVRLNCIILRDEDGNVSIQSLIKIGGPGQDGSPVATTDKHGRYRLTNLPIFWEPSYLDLRASAPGYVSRDQRLTMGEKWSKDEIKFELFAARVAISGKVVDDHGVPLPGRSVNALINGERMPACYTRTNQNGRFELRNCPASAGLQVRVELCRSPAPHLQNAPDPWYYLDVIQDIVLIPGQAEYEVTLTAQRPDLTLNVKVKNSEGQPLPHFPVVLDARDIPTEWSYTKFFARTDAQGRCTFKNVPRAENLHVELRSGTHAWHEQLSDEVRRVVDSYKNLYSRDIPVHFVPEKVTYSIEAIVLTWEEHKARKR